MRAAESRGGGASIGSRSASALRAADLRVGRGEEPVSRDGRGASGRITLSGSLSRVGSRLSVLWGDPIGVSGGGAEDPSGRRSSIG
jgi:hypothetical protein